MTPEEPVSPALFAVMAFAAAILLFLGNLSKESCIEILTIFVKFRFNATFWA